jgi:hypothetical protein
MTRALNIKIQIEKMITNKVAEYLLGVACPIPEDSGTDENVDSSGENVDSSGENVDSSGENVDEVVDTKPQPHNRSQLAKRLNCSPPTINNYLKKGTKHGANQFCLSRDSDGYKPCRGARLASCLNQTQKRTKRLLAMS